MVRVREPGHRALLEFRGPVYPIDVTGQQVLGEGSCRKAGGLGERPEKVEEGRRGAIGRQEGLERGQGKLRKAGEVL